MIAVVAVSISFLIAPTISKLTANYLVEQQVAQEKEEKELDADKVGIDFQETEQELTDITVHITTQMMMLDGICILVLISLSVVMAGTSILRRNPKDILSEMS